MQTQHIGGGHDDNPAAGTGQFGVGGMYHCDNRGHQGPTVYAFGNDVDSGSSDSSDSHNPGDNTVNHDD